MSLDATRWAWTRPDLSAIEKLILLALADRADERDSCFPGIETLAHDTSANRKTIMGALRSLEASGLIEVERANGAGNRYRLVGVEHRTSPKNGTGTEIGTSPKNGTAPVPKTGLPPVPNLGLESTIEPTKNRKTMNPAVAGLVDRTADAGSDDPSADRCPHQKIIALYHRYLPACPQVRSWAGQRPRLLTARWREHPDLAWWDGFLAYCGESMFLTGRVNGSKDRPPFQATLEWICRPQNFQRINEGQYHR